MVEPVYTVGIEFESGSFTTITDDVVKLSIARTLGDALVGYQPGDAQFILINSDGKYSPDNPGSDFAGLMRPQLAIQVTATYAGSSYNLFKGTIDQWTPNPNIAGPRTTLLAARDEGKNLKDKTVTTSLFTNYNAGSAFTEVLTDAGVTDLSVDTMTDEFPFLWFRDRTARNAIEEMLEAGFSFAYVDGGGTLNIKKRYFEIEGTVVASIEESFSMGYTLTDDFVANEITIEGEPRVHNTNPATLASIPQPFFIQASSHIHFFLEYLDPDNNEPAPGLNMITPVSSQDFKTNVASDGTGTDRTSVASVSTTFFGQTAVNTVFNGSGDDVYLTDFVLRGEPVQRKPRFSMVSENSSSQSLYGIKRQLFQNPLIPSQLFGQDYADFLLNRQQDPVANVSIGIRNEFPLVLRAELADKFHITNSFLGVNSIHTISQVAHTIDLNPGLVHQVDYGLARFRDQNVLILDNTTFGKLDERRLGF